MSYIDHDVLKLRKDTTSMAQVLKHGHRGLLTTNFGAPTKDLTSHLDAYRPITGPGIRVKGQQLFVVNIVHFDTEYFKSSSTATTLKYCSKDYNVDNIHCS